MNQGASQALDPNVLAQLDMANNLGQRLNTNPNWVKARKVTGAISSVDKARLETLVTKFDGANAQATFNFEVREGVVYADNQSQVNKAVNILTALAQLCAATESICAANQMHYDEQALITSGFVGTLVDYARVPTCNNEIAGKLRKALGPIKAG